MAASLQIDVLRALDLLALRLEFHNLVLAADATSGPRLVRDRAGARAFVVIHFPPQHVAEQALTDDVLEPSDFPVNAGLCGPSRLAFRLPDHVVEIPFTLDGLLDWSQWEPSLVPAALPPGTEPGDLDAIPELRPPNSGARGEPPETAIELPYGLVLSPDRTGVWSHATGPVTRRGRTELWHTRLGLPISPDGDGRPQTPAVRGVWVAGRGSTRAYPHALERDVEKIMHVSANFGLSRDEERYVPEPVLADRLMLSSLGGWLRARGDWDPPDPPPPEPPEDYNLSQWQHVATQGRDHFVRTVHEGYLFPFGHRAAIVTVTERKTVDVSGWRAPLRTSHFLIVREPSKHYAADEYPHEGREMPLAERIRLTTLVFQLDPPPPERKYFWVMRDGAPLRFPAIGTDVVGAEHRFSAAMLFVERDLVDRGDELEDVRNSYLNDTDSAPGQPPRLRRVVPMPGTPVAMAPPLHGSAPGDTTLTVHELLFAVEPPAAEAARRASLPFLPTLERVSARVPAVEQLAGAGANAAPVGVVLAGAFLEHGLDAPANKAQLFAEFADAELQVKAPPERAGAIVDPGFSAKGLSRHLGPVGGDLAKLAAGQFDPSAFFPGDAKLLGAVTLGELIAPMFEPGQFPRVLQRLEPAVEPSEVVTSLDLAPKLVESNGPLVVDPARTSLAVHTEVRQPLDGRAGSAATRAMLSTFSLDFLKVLRVDFDSLTFTTQSGQKPDFSAEIAPGGIQFRGPLAFVDALRRYIPFDGFRDPPAVDVGRDAISVGYTLGLPPLAVGVFALQDIRLGARLDLPYTDGKARLRFAFSERHEPFRLSVSGLAGGGFFGLAVGVDGIEMIEAALEFGAAISIDLGVARGGVHIMAGIYFRYAARPANEIELTGYLRCGGALEVLGLISVSVEFYMALSYISDPDRLEGQATLTVKIDLFLFSKSVQLTVRRTFAGGGAAQLLALEADAEQRPLTFGDTMSAADWSRYAGAFA